MIYMVQSSRHRILFRVSAYQDGRPDSPCSNASFSISGPILNLAAFDLKSAAKIQETFLPREVPRVPGTDFAWTYRPCDELAGDGLNAIPLGDGKVALYVLDVSGHGVASALLSVTMSRLLSPPSVPSSILTRNGDDRAGSEDPCQSIFDIMPPAAVAAHLNRLFPFDVATEQFTTMVYGILHATGEFRYGKDPKNRKTTFPSWPLRSRPHRAWATRVFVC